MYLHRVFKAKSFGWLALKKRELNIIVESDGSNTVTLPLDDYKLEL